jgi:hypothetical protein
MMIVRVPLITVQISCFCAKLGAFWLNFFCREGSRTAADVRMYPVRRSNHFRPRSCGSDRKRPSQAGGHQPHATDDNRDEGRGT